MKIRITVGSRGIDHIQFILKAIIRELKIRKAQTFIINNSRGLIVDEDALINAFKNKRIVSAGIDVFAEEPTSKDNSLFNLAGNPRL